MPVHQKNINKKLVVVGDGNTGKTCLLFVQTNQGFPTVHVPTVFETYMDELQIGDTWVNLQLWDTAGQEEFASLRTLSYNQTDIVIMLYSIDNPDSLENIREIWYPEIRHYCPYSQIVLVGNKSDLRHDPATIRELAKYQKRPVTFLEGQKMADSIGAALFFETSALNNLNVNNMFQQAVKHSLENPISHKKFKSFLCGLIKIKDKS